MNERFTQIQPGDIGDNIFSLIGKEWMLITAGTIDHYNMMTASWGTAGILWRKPVVFAFIRPQRYTFEFMEKSPYFSVSFFPDNHKDMLNLCGTTSGRDLDKMGIDGLNAIDLQHSCVGFQEARMIWECRKIYFDDVDPSFFQVFDIEKIYPNKDYHRMYIGEILRVWSARDQM